jgi:hypothetical protein
MRHVTGFFVFFASDCRRQSAYKRQGQGKDVLSTHHGQDVLSRRREHDNVLVGGGVGNVDQKQAAAVYL